VVDTTHVTVLQEKSKISSQYWFFKHKCFAIKYQIVVSLSKPLILLQSNSIHDFKIAKKSGLDDLLKENDEIAIGDKAYKGSYQFVTPHKVYKGKQLTEEQKKENKILESKRHIVENMNKRLKHFRVIKDTWRHDISKHPQVFNIVAMLTNLDLMMHPLKMND
jgi:hypothetical protein